MRNPAYLIKKLTRPEDVVVFKLDVDSPQTELAIMRQVRDESRNSFLFLRGC